MTDIRSITSLTDTHLQSVGAMLHDEQKPHVRIWPFPADPVVFDNVVVFEISVHKTFTAHLVQARFTHYNTSTLIYYKQCSHTTSNVHTLQYRHTDILQAMFTHYKRTDLLQAMFTK